VATGSLQDARARCVSNAAAPAVPFRTRAE